VIIIKHHGGIKVWMLEKCIVTIHIKELANRRRWLPICLLALNEIINIVIIPNHYVPHDKIWLPKLNINKLLLKWMPCDLVCH
jgi:hypothetical protein